MTWGDSHYGTYATTRTWLNDAAELARWEGMDDDYPDHLDDDRRDDD